MDIAQPQNPTHSSQAVPSIGELWIQVGTANSANSTGTYLPVPDKIVQKDNAELEKTVYSQRN